MPVASRDSTRFVALFQKAHGCFASLQRVDEQIATMFEQRRKVLEDLRAVQSQINGEFDRVLELGRVVPSDILASAEEPAAAKDRTAPKPPPPIDPVKTLPAPAPRLAALEPAAS